MKKSKAEYYLRLILLAGQRIRSIQDETDTIILKNREVDGLHLTEEMASWSWPYIWGEKSILPILAKILDKDFTPLDFYNQIFIATRLEPLLGVAAGILGVINGDNSFPTEADMNWLKGWEEE